MKKTKKLIVGSLIAITLGTVGVLAAGGFEHRWGHQGQMAGMIAERMLKHATKELDLTEVQQQNLEVLQQKVLSLRSEGREAKRETRKQVMMQLSQPTLDQEQVMNLVRERLQMAEQKAPEVIAALAVFSDSLTAEQKEIIKSKIENRKNHHGEHHGQNQGGHPAHR